MKRILALFLCINVGGSSYQSENNDIDSPFLWGVATAAYQIEGATLVEGRGPSIWDTFSLQPNKIAHNDTGEIGDDSYRKISEDVALIKAMGLNSYRFSISWSRILPSGSLSDGNINYLGIRYYNKLIDELIDSNIEPLVTLYHWDLPQALEDKYEGWLSPKVEDDFRDYADLCFSNFGDRVKRWITINEPWTYCLMGYGMGAFAPGRCSDRSRCAKGNTSIESYIAAHNSLNAHAAVVELYRSKYQAVQKGIIGITLNLDWAEPLTDIQANREAATTRNEFAFGWFADPIVFGRYPQSMVDLVGSRLPRFSASQSHRLKGSSDFIGLNHYSSKFYSHDQSDAPRSGGWIDDQRNVESKYSEFGALIGPQAASPWLNVVPWGFYKVLRWVNDRYTVDGHKPVIYVTENGVDVPNESTMPLAQALHDTFRIDYYQKYLAALDKAIKEGLNIRGYFAWSLMDNFEWADGYDYRFGLHYVDYTNPSRPRYAKESSRWYASYAANHSHYAARGERGKSQRAITENTQSNGWLSYLVDALELSQDCWFLSNL